MAATTTEMANRSGQETVSLLDKPQVLKASKALLKHIKTELLAEQAKSSKKNLLAPDPSDSSELANTSLWLILTTKKHISDTARLKPSKIILPHSLSTSGATTICLITASPQHIVQEALVHPAFPPVLASQITKVINVQRLKAHYKSFESRRQLLSEHDLFFADEKIVTQLPELLGKVFYKSSKRPIPVTLAPPRGGRNRDPAQKPILSNRPRRTAEERNPANRIASPEQLARQIERTLSCTPVNLSPGVTTAIRVGLGSFTAEQLAANIDTVVGEMVERFVPQKWKNVKAVYVKGPNSMALPVWLTTELWRDETDILEVREAENANGIVVQRGEKRKERGDGEEEGGSKKKTRRLEKGEDEDEDEKKLRQILHADGARRKPKPKKKGEKAGGGGKTAKVVVAAAA